MSSLDGADDLFGDGDSGDSLFGNDDDSLFDGSDDGQDEHITACSSKAEEVEASAMSSLSCPSVPDPHNALSCGYVGHTSGEHTVSTQDPSGNAWGLSVPEHTNFEAAVDEQAFRDQAVDTFPLAGHFHGDQADYQQHGQTACQSPGPSPSNDEMMQDLERMLEAEFAQDQDNLGQLGQTGAPSPAAQPNVQLPDDVQVVMEYNLLRDQATSATTTALGDQYPGIGIDAAAAEYRYAEAACRRGIRLPRRIDFDGADVNVLKPYLTLKRSDAASLHYERLELTEKSGKLLLRDLKEYVKLSPDAQHLKQRGRLDADQRRAMFLTAALRLLRHEGWGAKWFGAASPTANSRTLLWPSDSTLIALRFTSLLYKVVDQAKYQKPQKGRQQSTESRQSLEGYSQTSPIDLTNEDGGIPGIVRIPTPNTSACSSRRPSHMSLGQASNSGIRSNDKDFLSASGRAPIALPAYRSPAFHLADGAPFPDFYITEDSPFPAGSSDTEIGHATTTAVQEHIPPKGITLAMLAEQVADIKRLKQGTPTTRPVKYRLTFTDARDAQALRPPIVGILADEVVKSDTVVKTIRSAFGHAGVPATVLVGTADGPVEVATQDEWNAAVDALWQQYGDGAVVDVDIHV